MLKISRKVEYALMALQYMRGQQAGQVVSAKDLCATYQVAFPVLSKVLQNLAAAGVLRSEQGAHGGYQLARPLTDVTFGELSEAVLGPMQFSYCLHRDRVRCQLAECCNVISPVVRLSNRIEELFHSMSLEELLQAEEPQEAAIRARHRVSAGHAVPGRHAVRDVHRESAGDNPAPPHAVSAIPQPAATAPREQLVWK